MPTLDVRDIPPMERHPTIFETFDEMEPGDVLQIVNDHDPKPLYYQMAAEVESFAADDYTVERLAPDEFVASFPKRAE